MDKNTLLFGIAALLAGFIGGFLLANSINRSDMSRLSGQKDPIANTSDSGLSKDDASLSDAEIKSKIAEADKNPANFSFQKDLGIALYRYGAMKQDLDLLDESARILERANSINGRDFDVLVTLGNVRFDIGYAKKELGGFQKARELYAKALELKPTDADVKTDVGISYFVQEPPDYDKAAENLQQVVAADPRHSRSMQYLVQVYVKQNKLADAERTLAKLKDADPANPAVGDLTAQISNAKTGAGK